MTDQEQALAHLREQMGEGWKVTLSDTINGNCRAEVYRQGVYVTGAGPDPMSAARACVEAWQHAVTRHQFPEWMEAAKVLAAERAHADRLAEALLECENFLADGDYGEEPGLTEMRAAIKRAHHAHDARRAGEGR